MRLCSPPNDSRGAGLASSNHRLPLTPHHDRGGGPLWPAPACRQRGPSDLFGHLWSGRACRDRPEGESSLNQATSSSGISSTPPACTNVANATLARAVLAARCGEPRTLPGNRTTSPDDLRTSDMRFISTPSISTSNRINSTSPFSI